MKTLAAVFASIVLFACLLGFGLDVLPILALLGKVAAAIALAGFAVTAVVYTTEELLPMLNFEADDIQP